MRSTPRSAALAAFFAAASLVGVARADVPPPGDYVESCTVEKQCPGGKSCGTFHGEPNAECAAEAEKAGMSHRCNSWGATVGGSVFCPKDAPPPPADTTTKTPPKAAPGAKGCGGCATTSGGSSAAGAIAAALFVAAIVARKRR